MNARLSVFAISSLTDRELLERIPVLVRKERRSSADVIEHLVEIDRRRLYLGQACSSLFVYATERLGYSQDEAHPRVRVARVAGRIPAVLDELRNGAIHLTGLFLLSNHLTEDNCQELLTAARGKSRRQIEQLLAEWFPRPDAPNKITPVSEPSAGSVGTSPELTRSGTGNESTRSGTGDGSAGAQNRFRLEPLSPGRYRVEFTASAELAAKLERARELLSHALPSGDLAALMERAVDRLLEHETLRRFGSEKKRRKQRPLAPGSRHIPLEVARQVRERDGGQCTFVNEDGRRCSARRFLTFEHRHPFALGGPPTVENICLLCKSHNERAAREVFGEEHIETKRAEREKKAPISKKGNERGASGEGHPQRCRTVANTTAPGATAPGATAPGATAPGATAPGATALDATAPDARSESGATSPVKQRAEHEVYARVLGGLRELGFRAKEAEAAAAAALGKLKGRGLQATQEQLLCEALSLLVHRGKE